MALQFEHPTIAGVTVGGWMNRADAQPRVAQARPPRPSSAWPGRATWPVSALPGAGVELRSGRESALPGAGMELR